MHRKKSDQIECWNFQGDPVQYPLRQKSYLPRSRFYVADADFSSHNIVLSEIFLRRTLG